MKFSIQPPPGESAFDQWRDAMKAVCRLPMGMPSEFRKKVWLSLADHYLFQLKINWEQTIRFAFNERSNPDDEQLGMQIVKDLHRTGCSNFSGDENEEDRAVLKRLLLAYARWNKRVGYCQGFNVIAALLLNVMDRKEDDALKVMIYLIDSVLPESYFANNLRALSVDMAVFRDLLRLTYPKLSKHLDRLQLAAQDIRTGACYEPPLTNVFTMQWFLTLFATCLPVSIVLRVWDSILLEGSEVLLRTALTIWGKLAKRIMRATSADEFYSLMGELSSSVMQGSVFDGDTMVKSIYSMGDFPLPHLNELREKYTYNIRPISQPSVNGKKNGKRSVFKSILNSDEDDLDDDDITAMACLPGSSDISVMGPGVYGSVTEEGTCKSAPEMERMTTDIQSLKLHYERLKQRQRQAHIIIAAASAKKVRPSAPRGIGAPSVPAAVLVPSIESPVAMNHLFLGKSSTCTRNRLVTDGPRICAPSDHGGNSALLSKQLQAVASAHAVSKSKRMKTSVSSKGGTVAVSGAASSKTVQTTAAPEAVSCSIEAAKSPTKFKVSPVSGPCESDAVLCEGDGGPREEDVTSRSFVTSNEVNEVASELVKKAQNNDTHNTEMATLHEECSTKSVRNPNTEMATLHEECTTESVRNPNTEMATLHEQCTTESFRNPNTEMATLHDQCTAESFRNPNTEMATLHEECSTESVRNPNTETATLHEQCSTESVRNPITEKSLTTDLPLPMTKSEKSLLSEKDLYYIQFCEESNAYNFETSGEKTKKECFLLNLNSSQLDVKCENTESEAGRICDSESQLDENIPGCHTVQSKLCSMESLNSENLSVDRCEVLSGEISPRTVELLTTTKSALEDSGFESPWAVSPVMMQDRKFCQQNTVGENEVDVSDHEEDMVLSLEETSTELVDQHTQVLLNVVKHNCGSCNFNITKSPANLVGSKHKTDREHAIDSIPEYKSHSSEHKTDSVPGYKPHSEACVSDEGLESKAPTTAERDKVNAVESSRKISAIQNDSAAEMTSLLNAVASSAPHHELFARSSSVIETVSIPATVDVRKSDDEQSSMSVSCIHKTSKTSALKEDETDQEKGVVVRSDLNLDCEVDQHSSAILHKPSSQHKRTRRFSSPVGPDLTSSGSQNLGHPSLVKTASKPFNPFPVRHFNANRAKTGLKLGLYSESTLEKLRGLKPRTSSS